MLIGYVIIFWIQRWQLNYNAWFYGICVIVVKLSKFQGFAKFEYIKHSYVTTLHYKKVMNFSHSKLTIGFKSKLVGKFVMLCARILPWIKSTQCAQ
jgi:hypothetical protein